MFSRKVRGLAYNARHLLVWAYRERVNNFERTPAKESSHCKDISHCYEESSKIIYHGPCCNHGPRDNHWSCGWLLWLTTNNEGQRSTSNVSFVYYQNPIPDGLPHEAHRRDTKACWWARCRSPSRMQTLLLWWPRQVWRSAASPRGLPRFLSVEQPPKNKITT